MQLLINIEESELNRLLESDISFIIRGTDKDMLLTTVFGKDDIKYVLEDMVEGELYNKKFEPFVQEMTTSKPVFDKLVTDIFNRLNSGFDPAVGISNDLIELTVDSVFQQHGKEFLREMQKKEAHAAKGGRNQ